VLKVVAFGGGHGLAASLRGLRHCAPALELDITAVVTVGDDGGSSGRLRAERDALLPPGDLRQALAALTGDDPVSQRTAALLQHRFAAIGDPDPLTGHAVGNLLLLGLMELLGDPVVALEHAAAMVSAKGRVLPMARHAVGIEADVRGGDPKRPGETVTVRGQHAVAVTMGHVEAVRLTPVSPADLPGRTVRDRRRRLAHLRTGQLVHQRAAAPARTRAGRRHRGQPGPPARHAESGRGERDRWSVGRRPPGRAALVPAGAAGRRGAGRRQWVGEPEPVHRAAAALGARLVLAPLAVADRSPRHDPESLGVALVPVLGANR
jgi:hypothetical protein